MKFWKITVLLQFSIVDRAVIIKFYGNEPFGALDALTKRKLQAQVLEIWEGHRQAVMMITHDVDEAIYMSDRIILMTNGPKANIGKILNVPFPHPRDRHMIQESQEYYELRNQALDFLEQYQ